MSKMIIKYRNTMVAAISLTLLFALPTLAGPRGKAVKPVRTAPQSSTRSLHMPTHQPLQAGAGLLRSQLTARKRQTNSSGWKVRRDKLQQTPIFIEFDRPVVAAGKNAATLTAEVTLINFVAEHRAIFGLVDPQAELRHTVTRVDAAGRRHVKLATYYNGVPIWGAQMVGHLDDSGGLYAINGRYRSTPDYIDEFKPKIPREVAIDRARVDLASRQPIKALSFRSRQLLKYYAPSAELCLWSPKPEAPLRLTWIVEIRPNIYERWRYFYDATDGQLTERYQASPSDGPALGNGINLAGETVNLHTLEDDGLFYLIDGTRKYFDQQNFNLDDPIGALWTIDAQSTDVEVIEHVTSTDNNFTDPVSVSAHENMARIYEYFLTKHGREGISNDATATISIVHVTEDGESMENAYWNGVFMAYGDGGEYISPLAESLDIAAHEMTHGIIERTVNLEYRNQSGALNESFADIFGVLIDDGDWLVGEDVVNKDYFPSGALRDVQNPHNGATQGGWYWQPAHMDEFQEMDESEDNGGVHVNSGIPNRAAYLIAEEIGREKMAKIYYHILDAAYLTPRSQFIDCRLAAERAAADLFGDESAEVQAVQTAFDAVGIGSAPLDSEPVTNEGDSLPPENAGRPQDSGEHWVATTAAELDGDNSLWMVKPTWEFSADWEDITQLTPTQVFAATGNAITAPLNGDFLFFVDAENNLRYISTDGTEEEVINADGDWSSIALSPDGTRLAATTIYADSTIYYFDLEDSNNNRAIQLFHSTTQENIAQSITRYADALQWDATGSYIVYDAFNSLPTPSGQTIDFWTVNLLDPINDVIWPLFPPQPEGVHIGNSSLSTTILADGSINDCRLLYERLDEKNAVTEIRMLDLCTGEAALLHSTDKDAFTFPNFCNGAREIVFEEWFDDDGVDTANLWRLQLSSDRLNPLGQPLLFVPNSQSPKSLILAGEAQQPTAVAEETERPSAFSLSQNYPNPFNAETTISYQLQVPHHVYVDIFNVNGQRVTTLDQGLQFAGSHAVSWSGINSSGKPVATGLYFYQLRMPTTAATTQTDRHKMLLLR
ncbi:MAG: T9SS type A sorting domain-containing protein [Gemmatimonadetes bacterium]|nr:T9SS type A sorting domain-containing protein [Gemmatimonadota bacterium]